jgi:hypothetical protein
MTDGEAAVLDDLEAEAVPLGLVQPITALGWTCDRRGDERTDEREVPRHMWPRSRSSPLVLQALTHQPTFGNKLVAFLRGDASVARSGYCIQLDGYVFGRILGRLEPFHQFLEGHSPLALLLL